MQRVHLHKRANGHCKNQVSGCGEAVSFSISVSVNGGITAAIEAYIVSTTETDVNGGIMTLLEIDIMSITECDTNHC